MAKISYEPVVIIGMPRSFTSLTAGIFRDHGVWFGKYKDSEYAPTGSCENFRLKRILKSHSGPIVHVGEECPPFPGFREKFEAVKKDEGYPGGPWGAKHSAVYWNVWKDYKPKYICCRRPIEGVLKSGERVNFASTNEAAYKKHYKIMDRLVSNGLAVDVRGEEYFKGNWSELERAFEFCGLDFNQKTAENLLDHNLKHF